MGRTLKSAMIIALFVFFSHMDQEDLTLRASGSIGDKIQPNRSIRIEWVDKVEGDYSFIEDWSYPEGVYRNSFDQLSCDGICPPEIDRLQDENGRIYAGSLKAFYQIVDTTHLYHSIKSEAWTYEWAGTDFITFGRLDNKSVVGQTDCNAATHSSLNIKIQQDSATAWIDFKSIAGLGRHIFPLKYGSIKMDKTLIEKGIVKADFDLIFENTIDKKIRLYWRGLIYSEIEN